MAGLTDFAVYGAWALRGTAPGVGILARTGAHGWVDLNRDNQLSPGDAMQPFGVDARLGDPAEDLAWPMVRMWRFRNDHLPVGGFSAIAFGPMFRCNHYFWQTPR